MYIRYIGHSSFFLEGAKKILIDPMPAEAADIDADLILITHAHGDHMNLPILQKLGAQTIAVHELSRYLQKQGVHATGMGLGGSIKTDNVTIRMVPALHSSSVELPNGTDAYMGSPCGFVVEMNGVSVYHAGDTALFSDMRLIHDLYHPDVALLPAGGHYTMGPEEAMIAAEWVGAPLVIPMHYNTFPAIEQDLSGFKKAIEATTAMQVNLLSPGEGVEAPPRQ